MKKIKLFTGDNELEELKADRNVNLIATIVSVIAIAFILVTYPMVKNNTMFFIGSACTFLIILGVNAIKLYSRQKSLKVLSK